MRRSFLLLLPLAIVGLLLYVVWGQDPNVPEGGISEAGGPGVPMIGDRPDDISDADALAEDAMVRSPAPTPVLATTGSLVVTVVYAEDGTPAADVGLDVRPDGPRGSVPGPILVRTDELGVARIEGLPPGPFRVGCNVVGAFREAEIKAGEEVGLTIELKAGVNITGSVVDSDGIPVPGAGIEIGAVGQRVVRQNVTTTGPDGRFVIRGARTMCVVGARAPSFAASPMYMLHSTPGSDVDLRIVLPGPGGAVEGQVLGPEGEPIAGAVVRLGATEFDGAILMLPGGVQGQKPAAMELRSDADGRFRAEGLPLGHTPVEVGAVSWAPWIGQCQVVAGVTPLVVNLAPGVVCTGTVVDAVGQPAEGVEVRVGRSSTLAYFRARTSADGTFRMEGLPLGEIQIDADGGDRGDASATLYATVGETLVWDGQLGRGVELRGRVLTESGDPVQGIRVLAFTPSERGAENTWFGSDGTDEDGRFLILNCPENSMLRVEVRVGGRLAVQREDVDPRAGEITFRVEARPEPSAHIAGTIVDPDGQPVHDAQIIFYGSGAGTFHAVEAGTGKFAIGPVRPGEINLVIQASGFPTFRFEGGEVLPDATVDLGMIHLERGGELSVRFHYAGDGPRPVTSVQALPGDGSFGSGYIVTDSHNEALLPGTYRLSVGGPEVAAQSIPFEVRVGATTNFDVTVEHGLRRDFVFDLPFGSEGVERVLMKIEGERGIVSQRRVGRFDREEITAFTSLAPGRYTVTASTDEGHEGRAEFTVSGSGEGEVVRVVLR